MEARLKRLTRLEKENKKKLAAALALLFLRLDSESNMMFLVPELVTQLRKEIGSLHGPAKDLANRDTSQFTETVSVQDTRNQLRIAGAALGLVSTVVTGTELNLAEGGTFRDAISEALERAQARVDRIATTETFTAYNKQFTANLSQEPGFWRWDAILDKQTCSKCSGLHGKVWEALSDVPAIPVHSNCRCVLQFIPK